jgi:hypothetical protein
MKIIFYLLGMQDHAFRIDRLALTHGQARWVLHHVGLYAGDDERKFDAYIKSLRRDGVPFAREELGVGAGYNLTYGFPHLMELAVALALRTQGILSRHIVALLAENRSILRPCYRQAWMDRNSGLGAPRSVEIEGSGQTQIAGTYLDLSLTYSPQGFLRFAQPVLLDPVQAFDSYMAFHRLVYPRPPLPISQIAEGIVQLAESAPEIKRGRRS